MIDGLQMIKTMSIYSNSFQAMIMREFIEGFLAKNFWVLHIGSWTTRISKRGLRRRVSLVCGVLARVSIFYNILD
jgi:hypothetical protein